MKRKKISKRRLLAQFIWLEWKKLQKPWDSIPKLSLLFYAVVLICSFFVATLGHYYPLFLYTNPRAHVILSLFVLTFGMMILAGSAFVVPGKEALFATNPYHFDKTDLNILSQTSNDPISWALIGFFRNSLKVLLYVFFLAFTVISYAIRSQIPWPNIILVLITLYLGIQLFMLLGTFVYTFTEELLEQLRPRWREQNFSLLNNAMALIGVIVILGGLVFISTSENINSSLLEQIILNWWYLPPFNIIYLVLAALSKTWSQTYLVPTTITLILEWGVTLGLFFLIHGKIDPLARLYERQPLHDAFSVDIELALTGYYIFTSFFQGRASWFNFLQYESQFIHEVVSLLHKDLLMLDKYRISLNYTLIMLVYGIIFVFWFVLAVNILPWFTPVGILTIVIITLFLWVKESKVFLVNCKISFKALVTEKMALSFVLAGCILVPIGILGGGIVFLGGLGVYMFCFVFGMVYYTMKPTVA
ncbi:MAG: hypothetical protein ACFFFG_02520 [Candidatus Thorarchaeota archaeon]